MDEPTSLRPVNDDRSLAPSRAPRHLTHRSAGAVARAVLAPLVQRAVIGLARREPAPMLAVGVSAGLLIGAALRGRRASYGAGSLMARAAGRPSRERGDLLAVETLVVRTVRILRAP